MSDWERGRYDTTETWRLDLGVIAITVAAQTWSNREQRHSPVTETTPLGVWINEQGPALGTEYPSKEDAQRIGILEAKRRLRESIVAMNVALETLETR